MLSDMRDHRVSPLRVTVALLVVLALGAGAFLARRGTSASGAAGGGGKAPWFAPYVDATLTPAVPFQDRAANPARDVVLGFVVAGSRPGERCTPTWGTYATLGGAATTIGLDRRIAQLRRRGGDAAISFGGQANSDLAVACASPAALLRAYRAVIARYAAGTVDVDVEGAALTNAAASLRRARAIAALQAGMRAHGRRLAVWLTLPATPQGLDAGALAVVRTTLAAKVDLAGVNAMAMDFGVPSAARDMRGAIESSLSATRRQLASLLRRAGVRLDAAQLWRKLGMTVMIGRNDSPGERVTVADARALAGWVARQGLGRVSLWSLNRDRPCGVLGTRSNLCSGVAQTRLQFSTTFARIGPSAAG